MKRTFDPLCAALCIALAASIGCGGPAANMAAKSDAGHGHDHAKDKDHGHDHGHDHAGPSGGPHGGTVADWGGGKYHVEFTVDHDQQTATVYILGGDAKTAAPLAAKDSELALTIREPAFEVRLKAAPLEGETGGKASRYTGKHASLGKVQEFAGSIIGEIDGTPYSGDFKEEPHDHK
jgi:hypothetical protein